MKQLINYKNIGISLLLTVSGLGLKAQNQEKPNILWITFEDTSPEFIGSYGNKHVKTPVMDRLAEEGVRFTSAFSTAPVCSPSRSTLITGCSTEAMGTGNHRCEYPLPIWLKGFPSYLKQAGYYTSNNQKTDYNFANKENFILDAWNESSGTAGYWNRNPGQPFFAVFNLLDSHQSRTMTNPYNWYVEKVLDKLPPESRTTPDEISMPPFYHDTPEMRRDLSRVYNSLNLTDINIGKILNRLKQENLMENTIVFVFADHGEGIPKGKTSALGFGYRVPFFVYFPEKYKHLNPWVSGKPTDELISLEDLAPTILSLAEAKIPDHMKGRPFIGKDRKNPRQYVYGSRNRIDESPDLERSATDGQFFYTHNFMSQLPMVKFIKYMDVADITRNIRKDWINGLLDPTQAELVIPSSPVEYLFDMKNDPWQINNLASNLKYASKLKELRKAVQNRILEIRDVMFMPEYLMNLRIDKSKSTPYEIRIDQNNYPLKEIVTAANLSGQGKKVIKKQLNLLADDNPDVRYWAAVGLDGQKEAIKPYKAKILSSLNDPNPAVQIVIAGIAFKQFQDEAAKKILEKHTSGDNDLLILQALQTIQYMRESGKPFLPLLNQVQERFSKKVKGVSDNYNIVSITDATLYFLNGKALFFNEFKKWVPDSQLKEDKMIRFGN